MKKLLLLSAFLIFACSSDDSSDTNDNGLDIIRFSFFTHSSFLVVVKMGLFAKSIKITHTVHIDIIYFLSIIVFFSLFFGAIEDIPN